MGDLKTIVLALSLALSFAGATTTFAQPEKRWLTFRAAALTLESEIWKFRTSFAINVKQESREREEELLDFVKRVHEQVSKSASTGTTKVNTEMDLFGRPRAFQKDVCVHGQYDDHEKTCQFPGLIGILPKWVASMRVVKGLVTTRQGRSNHHEYDDHHTPLDPEQYIQFRVKPAILFYQSRLPLYYKKLMLLETLMLAGQVTAMLLSAFGLARWTTMVTAGVVTVTAWRSFSQTDKKLTRYSNAVEKANVIIPWWEQLDAIEKSNSAMIGQLVDTCEDVFRSEWDTWTNTSMRLQKMSKKTQEDADAPEENKNNN